jgi:hypothetical protein
MRLRPTGRFGDGAVARLALSRRSPPRLPDVARAQGVSGSRSSAVRVAVNSAAHSLKAEPRNGPRRSGDRSSRRKLKIDARPGAPADRVEHVPGAKTRLHGVCTIDPLVDEEAQPIRARDGEGESGVLVGRKKRRVEVGIEEETSRHHIPYRSCTPTPRCLIGGMPNSSRSAFTGRSTYSQKLQ